MKLYDSFGNVKYIFQWSFSNKGFLEMNVTMKISFLSKNGELIKECSDSKLISAGLTENFEMETILTSKAIKKFSVDEKGPTMNIFI